MMTIKNENKKAVVIRGSTNRKTMTGKKVGTAETLTKDIDLQQMQIVPKDKDQKKENIIKMHPLKSSKTIKQRSSISINFKNQLAMKIE
jgi:hypothetical protein